MLFSYLLWEVLAVPMVDDITDGDCFVRDRPHQIKAEKRPQNKSDQSNRGAEPGSNSRLLRGGRLSSSQREV